MSEKIKPFILINNNQCPKCLSRLELIEVDIYVGMLDKRGRCIKGDESTEAYLTCTKCREEYPVTKKGQYYSISPTTEKIKKIIPSYNPFYSV